MENPIDYLKAAVFEEDEEKRLEKVIAGCKIITDALPFDRRIESIVKVPNLVQYLLLTSIFSRNSVTMILNSLLDKFRDSSDFLELFWSGLQHCAQLKEQQQSTQGQSTMQNMYEEDIETSFTRLKYNSYSEYMTSFSPMEYNSAIRANVVSIKYISLSFVYDIYTLYANEKTADFDEKNGLFITYLFNANEERFILTVVDQVEKIKATFLFFFHQIMDFDDQFEEVIMTKGTWSKAQSEKYKSVQEQSMWDSQSVYSSTNSNQIGTPQQAPALILTKSRFQEMGRGNSVSSSDSRPESPGNNVDGSPSRLEPPSIVRQIEEWMVSSSIPIIGKSEFMIDFFKLDDNVELILNFIMEPLLNRPSVLWVRNYPRLNKDTPCRDIKAYKLGHNAILDQEVPVINAIMMRSYKLLTILSERRNLRVVCNACPTFFQLFYDKVYKFLRGSEQGNLYHLGKLIDAFLRYSPDFNFYYILLNNLMYCLLDHIYNPQIFQLVNDLCNVQWNVYKLTDDVSKMVLEYLNVTGFAIELGALLFNSEINDSFKRDKAYKKREILLMQSKIANKRTEDLKYRKKIEPLPMVSENLLTPEDAKLNKDYLDEVMGAPASHMDYEYFSMKELIGQRGDIDGVRKIKTMKKLQLLEMNKLKASMAEGLNSLDDLGSFDDEDQVDSLKRDSILNLNQVKQKLSVHGRFKKAAQRLLFIRLSKKSNAEAMLDSPAIKHKPIDFETNARKRESQVQFEKLTTSFNTTNSFNSATLVQLYPDPNTLVVSSEIEALAKEKEFSSEKIIQKEIYSNPGCSLTFQMLSEAFGYQHNKPYYDMLKLQGMTMAKRELIFRIFLESDAKFFEKLISNYLVKMRVLSKLQDFNNSAFEAGRVVNLILSHIDQITHLTDFIHEMNKICANVFDFACKTLIHMHNNKRSNFYLQNFKIVNPIGSCKLLLFETICLILRNDQQNASEVIRKVSDTTWHVMLIQFFNHPSNQFYGKHFLSLMSSIMQIGTEKILKSIFFRLNCLSSMSNAYDNIVRNSVVMHRWHIDSFLIYLKQLIAAIDSQLETTKFSNLKPFLLSSSSWVFLKAQVFPKGTGQSKTIKNNSGVLNQTALQKKNKNTNVQSSLTNLSFVEKQPQQTSKNLPIQSDTSLQLQPHQLGLNSNQQLETENVLNHNNDTTAVASSDSLKIYFKNNNAGQSQTKFKLPPIISQTPSAMGDKSNKLLYFKQNYAVTPQASMQTTQTSFGGKSINKLATSATTMTDLSNKTKRSDPSISSKQIVSAKELSYVAKKK